MIALYVIGGVLLVLALFVVLGVLACCAASKQADKLWDSYDNF